MLRFIFLYARPIVNLYIFRDLYAIPKVNLFLTSECNICVNLECCLWLFEGEE